MEIVNKGHDKNEARELALYIRQLRTESEAQSRLQKSWRISQLLSVLIIFVYALLVGLMVADAPFSVSALLSFAGMALIFARVMIEKT